MTDATRRRLLQLIGATGAAGAMPKAIADALEIPAHNRKGSIEDVEHIVILTQENRSFDHYFGTLRGVRGFADPRTVRLPTGKPVWNQPAAGSEVLPFRPDVKDLGLAFLPDPPHGWNDTHAAWNGGRHDQWIANKGSVAMTYHTRADIPWHFALAEAFTVCDAYHCSVMGPTDPNRYHLWSGWLGNDGKGGGPVITNAEAGYDWTTFPERLQAAGVTWRVYQDAGDGLDAAGSWGWTGGDPYIGNYGDNALLYLHQYQNAQPGSPLADFAKTGTTIKALDRDPVRLFDRLREDVRHNRLPQVAWIAAPEAFSEHPNFPANYGAWYASQVLEALTSNPEVWSRTVLLLNFDEEGGFFDHMVPPTPPADASQGASTVSTVNEIFPGDANHPSGPYGMGMRVPMIVASPWSRGGWVNSQVFDHTSVVRFIEARFGREHRALVETNITPWRRAVAGDLTSAFDFATPNRWRVRLPKTTGYLPPDQLRHDDMTISVPTTQSLPEQERGIRPARALPYALHAHGASAGAGFAIEFRNVGRAAAVFQVRSADVTQAPRAYTVEAGKTLVGSWPVGTAGHDLEVHGPSGFLRGFKGSAGNAALAVAAAYDAQRHRIGLTLTNTTLKPLRVRVQDRYADDERLVALQPGETAQAHWSVAGHLGWYDLVVTSDADPAFERRLAGHLENGRDSFTDPMMGGVTIDD